MKRILVVLLMVFVLMGCKGEEQKRVEKMVLTHLKEKYDEEFYIVDEETRYIKATGGAWEFEVRPESNPEISFYARTGGTFEGSIMENYYGKILNQEVKGYYKKRINDIFTVKQWNRATVGTVRRFDFRPTIKKVFDEYSEEMSVNIYIYIFEDVINNGNKKKQLLKETMELLEYLREQNLKWAQIHISIYDEEFFKDKDIDFILKETSFFYKGSVKLDYSAREYESYEVGGLGISRLEFNKIKSIVDLKKELYKSDKSFMRED